MVHFSSFGLLLMNSFKCIDIGTGEAKGAKAPPQYFTLDTLLIFKHAAQIAAIAVYSIKSGYQAHIVI